MSIATTGSGDKSAMNTIIGTINTERSLTGDNAAPIIKSFDSGPTFRFTPELFVKITGSTVNNDEDTIGTGIDYTPEIYHADVVIFHKSISRKLDDWAEIYAEALYRQYHLFCDANIRLIQAMESIREEVNFEEGQIEKIIGYSFDIFID